MDSCLLTLQLVTCTLMSLLCVFSHEVTVKMSDLKPCDNDNRVCVSDTRDCEPRPAASVQETLDMSCFFVTSSGSMTCDLTLHSNGRVASDVTLIFTSTQKVFSCTALFHPLAELYVTARRKDRMEGTETWSQPVFVRVQQAVKVPQPELFVQNFTADSVVVFWRSSREGSCRLRHRVHHVQTWSKSPDLVPVEDNQLLVHTFRDLLPFTTYKAAVSCKKKHSAVWSSWSSEVSVTTLCRAPSRPPEVCFQVEGPDGGGSLHLHLMWKGLDLQEAGGRVLGYQVTYEPKEGQRLQDRLARNVTEPTAHLVVGEGNYNVTVAAFNTAGYGPAAELSINTQTPDLPAVRRLWVSSYFPAAEGLLVQWESTAGAPPRSPPVSHFLIQWRPETPPSTSRWATVDSDTTSTALKDLDPDVSYLLSVVSVSGQQCGRPQTLPVSLKQGALMEVVNLRPTDVTKTQVTVSWEWQRKSQPIRVNGYKVMLNRNSDTVGVASLYPDQSQHTFLSLRPNTEYSLLLLADNDSQITSVRTDFDTIPVVATATPMLLFAVIMFILCILSRTVYKSYFFPLISSPRGSTAAQWLMDPKQQKFAEGKILDIKNFQVTDNSITVLGSKSLQTRLAEDRTEDAPLLSPSHLIVKLSAFGLGPRPECETDGLRTEDRHWESTVTSHQLLHDLLADRSSVHHMTCEADYLLNASCAGKSEAETAAGQTDSSYLMCDPHYISAASLQQLQMKMSA
ncbi:interleukin-6 receptor subunit beta isoform X2 [Echeneis naucrates]|nr:interleukin-6 receptor subunit beta-like isoform X2 [Echeneis naucrates]